MDIINIWYVLKTSNLNLEHGLRLGILECIVSLFYLLISFDVHGMGRDALVQSGLLLMQFSYQGMLGS